MSIGPRSNVTKLEHLIASGHPGASRPCSALSAECYLVSTSVSISGSNAILADGSGIV